MSTNGDEESSQRVSMPSARLRLRADPFLLACRCFSVLTSLTAILCISVNVLSAVRSFKNESDVLEYWVGRGMLQIFVAVMTRAFPDESGERKDLVLLQNIASYLLLACGLVYVISGILCIGFLKRAREQKEITREQAVKDLEELERRREELETFLVSERT
ncbi:PREDICTED: uncharacterized protein LOC104611919 isoform X2 [Nelumbo nucifera]|uniref:Uncharacterized protein LOC104611919 isoform X2 n=1 Tax=Nelumbo nucifera TaxID=4432 RepID=A0A1U8BCF1_NELNU|nr:PREDICTED: uncharacterized protein LOC104611919 isoform X2 [Nelumbo nucifera]